MKNVELNIQSLYNKSYVLTNQLFIDINPLASPSAGAPALKYGDVNTVTHLPCRGQRVN